MSEPTGKRPEPEEIELVEMGARRPNLYIRERRALEEMEREEKYEHTV